MVGLGPGDENCLTPEARQVILQADTIVGYKTYINLIADLVKDKVVVSNGMKAEVDRAQKAVELAASGRMVAVVSSGDPGIYGMAGLILELAGGKLPVTVVPGITAASAAAASLGAPLMHDFAVISLSDLLTPWDTIVKRLEAAAAADFVIVLYNPRSRGRQRHLEYAQQLVLKHRSPGTPVGIVKKARRGEEKRIITTLAEMLGHDVDMLTTVIIGNSQTRVESGYMITPRGYKI